MNRNGNIKNFYNPVEQAKPVPSTDNTQIKPGTDNTVKTSTLPQTSTKAILPPYLSTRMSDIEEKPVRDKSTKVL